MLLVLARRSSASVGPVRMKSATAASIASPTALGSAPGFTTALIWNSPTRSKLSAVAETRTASFDPRTRLCCKRELSSPPMMLATMSSAGETGSSSPGIAQTRVTFVCAT